MKRSSMTRRDFWARTAFFVAASRVTPWANAADTKPVASAERGSYRFAVIGDTGTGGSDQYKVGEQMFSSHTSFPFDNVIMMGDNMYGGESPRDFERKFEHPYASLLQMGVKFYASLGNHDDSAQRFYKGFNMGGKRYYSFKPRDGVRFFALDSNYMDREQVEWLEKELASSGSDWKIPYFHHPLYSSGETHGSSKELRAILEPIFIKHGVQVVFAGHEHFYERIKPQMGITYFIVGSSAKLRRGDLKRTDLTAKGSDQDNAFMLCEINSDVLTFHTLTKAGAIMDTGVISRSKNVSAVAGK